MRELESLRFRSQHAGAQTLAPGAPNPLAGFEAELIELRAEFTPAEADLKLLVRGIEIRYESETQELVVGGVRAPAPLMDGMQRLVVYVDRTGLEVFASDGRCYRPVPTQPDTRARTIRVDAAGGVIQLHDLEVFDLNSCWNAPH